MEKRKEENQKRIGEQFLIIRELLCMTQGDFADIFGIPKDSVKQLEQKEDLSEISIMVHCKSQRESIMIHLPKAMCKKSPI